MYVVFSQKFKIPIRFPEEPDKRDDKIKSFQCPPLQWGTQGGVKVS